jgi:predicted MFS family arabinose efflux permease/HAMP domain-containing protein
MNHDLRPRPEPPARPVQTWLVPLTSVTLLLLLLPLLGVSYYALVAFERKLLPEIEQKAVRVGLSVDGEIRRALDFGIPFAKLEGMEPFFAAKLEAVPDLAYIAVTARDGAVLYQHGRLDAQQREYLAAETAEVLAAGTPLGKLIPHYRLPAVLETLSGAPPAPPAARPDGGDFYRIALPVGARETDGVIHLGIDARTVAGQIEAMLLDIAVVLAVAVVAAFELLLLVAVSGVSEPLRQLDALLQRLGRGDFSRTLAEAARDRLGRLGRSLNAQIERVNAGYRAVLRSQAATVTESAKTPPAALAGEPDAGAILASGPSADSPRVAGLIPVRAAAFLLLFAEELTRPFFPLYVRELAPSIDGWSRDWPAAWSISLFVAALALFAPLAGACSARLGRRRLFLCGALLSGAGLIGTGFAGGYGELLLWRVLSALGSALAFAACQDCLFDCAGSKDRVRGAALVAGGLAAASFCGPAIGGILAERIGYGATFAAGAALAAAAGLLAVRFIPRPAPPHQSHGGGKARSARGKSTAKLLGNPRFLILTAFAAAPNKLLLTGFLFFLAPVLLAECGDSLSEIGRAVMGYGVAAAVCAPLFARLIGRWGAPGFAVGLGCVLAGLGLIPVLFAPGPHTVLLAATALGAGQALVGPAQAPLLALVGRDAIAASGERSVTDVYRVTEYLGAAAGPLAAAACADAFGYAGAALALGVFGTVSAVLFSAAFLILGASPEEDAAPAASHEDTQSCGS